MKDDRYQTTDEILDEIELGNQTYPQIYNDKASEMGLMVLNGEEPGKIYSFKYYNNLILIGRESDDYYNDIEIKEEWSSFISRRQATIDIHENNCYLRDGQWSDIENKWVYSKNGTYINYKLIGQNQFYKLLENDIILIGNTTLKTINI